jgi:uncharacterized protein YggU (UPF0235/DUF167 family)
MYVKVHVYAGMKREVVNKLGDNYYELILKVPAKQNAANRRVREIVAELYKVTLPSVAIVTGHHSPSKVLEVTHT